jgi:hypothetical protein
MPAMHAANPYMGSMFVFYISGFRCSITESAGRTVGPTTDAVELARQSSASHLVDFGAPAAWLLCESRDLNQENRT